MSVVILPKTAYKILLVDAPEKLSLWFNGTIPSPALSTLASYAKTLYDLKVLDLNLEDEPWLKLKDTLVSFAPDMVGVSCTHTCHSKEVLAAVRLIRKYAPGAVIIGGGVYFSAFCREHVADGMLDFIVTGEGEITFSQILRVLSGFRERESNGFAAPPAEKLSELKKIDGLAFMAGGEFVKTNKRRLISCIDSIPFPSYELYPLERYSSPTFGGTNVFGLTFGRGCSNRCCFCSECAEWDYTLRKPSPEYAVKHLEILYNNYGRNIFIFGDTDFLANKKWAEDFVRLIKAKGIKINFHIQSTCLSVIKNEDVIPKLKEIGLFEIMIGAESPFSDVLKRLNKPYADSDTVVRAMETVKKHGLLLMTMLVWGTEYDNRESLSKALRFFDKYADLICPSPLTPYPGTELYGQLKSKNMIYVDDFSLYDQAHVIVPAGGMTYKETRMAFEMELFKFFNLNPKFYAKIFSGNKFLAANQFSYAKLVWIHAFEGMLTQGGYRRDLFKNDQYLKIMNER